MVFYDEAEARKLYERYKLQWMVYHGLGLVDLMDCMEAMIQEDLTSSETRSKLQELFKAWEFDVGFPSGQIWSCYEEYRDNEYENYKAPRKRHSQSKQRPGSLWI